MAKKLSQFTELGAVDELDVIIGHSPSAGRNVRFKKETLLKEVRQAQQGGYYAFPTISDAEVAIASGIVDNNSGVKITNDSDSNNGYYHVESGSLVKDADNPADQATDAASLANEKAVEADSAATRANSISGQLEGTLSVINTADDYVTLTSIDNTDIEITETTRTTPNGYEIDVITINY